MPPHKPKVSADGRVSWPSIFRYRCSDGRVTDLPPGGGATWTLDILDLPAYEELARSGVIYHPRHTGAAASVTDNRRTS